MDEFDRRLQELVSQAQLYSNNPPKRRKIIQDLWDTMLPSSSLRGRQSKPTDSEAKRRLAGLKKWCRDKYGKSLEGDFEDDWLDALQNAQKEVLINIDIYQKGVDSKLYKVWQNFCKEFPPQQSAEIYDEFETQVEKFRLRFLQRRTRKPTKAYPLEKAQNLVQSCKTLCCQLQTSGVDIQEAWNTFCNEVQQLHRPRKFWNWFDLYVRYRFFDILRKRLNIETADAPAAVQEGSKAQTRLDQIQAISDARLSQQEIKLIDEDPDGVFRGKHIRNFPAVNFRAIAILKFQGKSLKEIEAHFGNQVNAQTTISPFYTRACHYFEPILEEYLKAELFLSKPVLEEIVSDPKGNYDKKKMPGHRQISFKVIIQSRLRGVPSWKILAQELKVNVKDLIEFYLDSISYFKLTVNPKRRTRRSSKNNQEID